MAELLAIVIPTLGASADLPGALAQCDDAHKAGLASQTIVSDGGSADDTVAIARAAGADVVVGDPGRGGQLRRAAFLVSTPWMLVLHADTRLSPEWLEAVAGHVRNFPDAAGYFGLRFSNRSVAARTVAAGANLRARYLGLPYGDQGLLDRKSVV